MRLNNLQKKISNTSTTITLILISYIYDKVCDTSKYDKRYATKIHINVQLRSFQIKL